MMIKRLRPEKSSQYISPKLFLHGGKKKVDRTPPLIPFLQTSYRQSISLTGCVCVPQTSPHRSARDDVKTLKRFKNNSGKKVNVKVKGEKKGVHDRASKTAP